MKNFVEKKLFLKVITGKINILKHVRNLYFWALASLKYANQKRGNEQGMQKNFETAHKKKRPKLLRLKHNHCDISKECFYVK